MGPGDGQTAKESEQSAVQAEACNQETRIANQKHELGINGDERANKVRQT